MNSSDVPTDARLILDSILDNIISLSAETSIATKRFAGYSLHRSPSPFPSWNTVFVTKLNPLTLARIKAYSSTFFREKQYRLTMLISNGDWIDEEMLYAAGFRQQKTNEIMIHYPTSRRQPAFRRKPVNMILNKTAVEEWTDVFTEVFFHRKSTNADYRLFRNTSGIDRFAAFIGDKPVGITSFYPTRRIAQIGSVAVRSRYRRRGIATELLRYCLTRALKRKMPVYLTVQEGNPSKKLYESAGFQSIGRQTYYRPMKLPSRSTRQ